MAGAVAARAFLATDVPIRFRPARPVAFPAVKYNFEDIHPLIQEIPQFEFKLQFTGDVTVQISDKAVGELDVTKSPTLSDELKSEYDDRFMKVVSQTKIKWSPIKRTAEVSCGFTFTTKMNGEDFVSHDVQIIPPNKLKYSLSPREVKGVVGGMSFKGTLGYELEITAKNDPSGLTAANPGLVNAEEVTLGVAAGLITLGVAIIVADIFKDVVTLGSGLVESPLSFSVAMVLFQRAGAIAH